MRPGRGAASGAGACCVPSRAEGREAWTGARRKQHRRRSCDPAGFWEHPELVYITPRQGSRLEAWTASLNKALARGTHVRDPRPGWSSGSGPHGPSSQGRSPGLGNGGRCRLLSKVRVGRVRPGACTCRNGRKGMNLLLTAAIPSRVWIINSQAKKWIFIKINRRVSGSSNSHVPLITQAFKLGTGVQTW